MVVGRGNLTCLIPPPRRCYSPRMDCDAYKRIPNALKFHRVRQGMWQKDVAARLGLKDTTLLSRWENGDSLPNLVSALRLSLLYQTSIEDLFGDLMEVIRMEVLAQEPEVRYNKLTTE